MIGDMYKFLDRLLSLYEKMLRDMDPPLEEDVITTQLLALRFMGGFAVSEELTDMILLTGKDG